MTALRVAMLAPFNPKWKRLLIEIEQRTEKRSLIPSDEWLTNTKKPIVYQLIEAGLIRNGTLEITANGLAYLQKHRKRIPTNGRRHRNRREPLPPKTSRGRQ